MQILFDMDSFLNTIWYEFIALYNCPYSNFRFLTNFNTGKIIHTLNKNEHALDMAAPLHDHLGETNGPIEDNSSVKTRTNVLLLGDHIGDLGMSDGLNYDTRISVGFL